ncbi:hypothetical protein P9153_16100 [Bacillus subtilis]|uniref:hypothetical protein n=1 Tax=Bacillus subtilis TaxID=1423 RepID=UPI002DC01C95|nr:hypothetical protein [Bacillus subtilis]MEC3691162.1 hypothetical protein [Bacillus subtilis]
MNIDKEIFKMALEIKRAKSFKNVFWISSFLKSKEDRRKKRLFFFLEAVGIIAYFLIGREFLFKNLYYLFEELTAILNISKSNAIIFTISLSIFPIMAIIAITLRKYAMLVDPEWEIGDLYYSLSYRAIKKHLNRKKYNDKVIEQRILPYIISKNSNLELYSIGSFLKVVIPSIVVAIPVSIFGIGFTTSINDNTANLGDFKSFLLALGVITGMLWFIGAASFKALPSLNIFSEKKAYKELELILQGYLLEKEVKLDSRKKIKRKV